MATQATSSTPSSTSSSSFSFSSCPPWKYHVFLSFCGVDTRKNFTDHLYTALKQKGIITFRDDEKLERGKYISQELLKAIEESKYAIIVLSTNYTSSRWCLIELAKIVKCKKETGLTVLPVFYHVDPSDVRNQNGILAEVFAKHEKDTRISTEDVQAWKAALKDVGDISGWHLHDRHESKIIQTIIGRIFSELFHKLPCVSEDLVGMDSCVEEMLDSYIGEGLGGVRFVGICGMGGMGKTTLAHEIYRRISGNFEGRSFIVNIREETKNQGLVSLQKQLLSQILMESEINIWDVWGGINVIRNILRNKNVFIILDDVDGDEQLKALAGKHDWFGPGSRIIVTSRDSHLLIRCGVDDVYNITGLNDDEALELFSWSAFKKPHPEENFVDLSKDFVNYAKGLPLALKVLGSLLFSKRTNEWKSALYKLKKEPNRNILDILQISFDGLTNSEKGLFLDIACFFKGENKDCIGDIFGSFYNSLDYDIGVLKDKSLITIYYNGTLWMHDLLQDMGQEIVRRESPKEPGGRSRLWIYDDVIHVLKNDSGTEKVEGIMVNIPIQKVEHLSAEAFSKMKNLRLLKISSEKLSEVFINGTMQLPKDLIRGKVQLPQGLNYLSNELRLLEWHGYHLKCLPTNFQLNKLVELRMHSSSIKQLWNGNMNLGELRLIDLSDSQNLIEMPDLSGASKLKQLIFRHCTRLYKIHTSLGDLKQLIQLDLNGCKCLESLPDKINLEALEILDLGGCSRLKKFPEIVGNMSRLPKLCLSETAIKDLPLSVEHLTGLIELDLRDCKNLSSLSNACCCLMSLKILTLSGCSKLDELPENLGNIEGLENLDNINLVNCVKLIYNQGKGDLWSAILRQNIIERCCNQKWYTCFTIPGSEIPNWFRHQNVGASVNLQVPSHLLLSGTLMGIAVCAVEANGDRSSYVWLPLSEEFGKIESYHLWLDCFPFETHFGSYRIEELDANEFTQIELTFEAYGPDLEVTKCGARLIFEQDIEDLKQTKPGSSSSIITPYHEDDDLGGDPKKDSKIKESGDDEAPHPKWTEHPNLIENWIGNSCIQGQADSDCV
ncbi:TMV resistance protein N-like isoform X2 [Quercus lobata]|uniref:TMV resistance protein N-like isoform X2 n=1 Tax=Quercus lobata TaxID=97700 RepID=UPI001243D01C|nr:TMV resistance protein N-like isoform X2 [Quercus lobata]